MLSLLPLTCSYKTLEKKYYCYFPTILVRKMHETIYDTPGQTGLLGHTDILVTKLETGVYAGQDHLPTPQEIMDFQSRCRVEFAGVVCRQLSPKLPYLRHAYVYEVLKSIPDLQCMMFIIVSGSQDAVYYYFDRSFLSWFEHTYSK